MGRSLPSNKWRQARGSCRGQAGRKAGNLGVPEGGKRGGGAAVGVGEGRERTDSRGGLGGPMDQVGSSGHILKSGQESENR